MQWDIRVNLQETIQILIHLRQTNMYDSNGRISIACKSKAKLMISFHVNNDALPNLTGFEIYCPCKSNLDFAGKWQIV